MTVSFPFFFRSIIVSIYFFFQVFFLFFSLKMGGDFVV